MLSHYTTKEESPLLYGDEFVCLLLSGYSQTRAVVSTFWADYFGSGRMQKKTQTKDDEKEFMAICSFDHK